MNINDNKNDNNYNNDMIGFNTSDDANDNINDSNYKVIPIIASTIMLMEITKKMIMTLIIWIILK